MPCSRSACGEQQKKKPGVPGSPIGHRHVLLVSSKMVLPCDRSSSDVGSGGRATDSVVSISVKPRPLRLSRTVGAFPTPLRPRAIIPKEVGDAIFGCIWRGRDGRGGLAMAGAFLRLPKRPSRSTFPAMVFRVTPRSDAIWAQETPSAQRLLQAIDACVGPGHAAAPIRELSFALMRDFPGLGISQPPFGRLMILTPSGAIFLLRLKR